MEAIIDRTVLPMVEGHFRRTVARIFGEVDGAHVKRERTDLFTASNQFDLAVGLADLNEWVLKKRLHTLAVSGAALRDSRARPADRFTQVLPLCLDPTLQGMVDET